MTQFKNIRVKQDVYSELDKIGFRGESYSQVMRRVLKAVRKDEIEVQ